MRLRAGDRFLAFSGDGREWEAEVSLVTKAVVHASVGALTRQEPPPPFVLEVWCGLVRSNRFDWAIEKCSEAGADVIRALLTEHVVRGDGSSAGRQARWERVAVEASEQCGRLFLPVVQPPAAFRGLVDGYRGALLVADATGRSWQEARALLPTTGHVAVAIGPEGGFSAEEVSVARARGAVLVSLGPNVLRSETAAVVATALVRAEGGGREGAGEPQTQHRR